MQKARFICLLAMMMMAAGGAKAEDLGSWSDSDNRDTSWGTDYTTATEFIINTPQQLAQFAYMVNSGSDFSGKTVKLDDVVVEEEYEGHFYSGTNPFNGDLDNNEWTPIGTADNPFKGTFSVMAAQYKTLSLPMAATSAAARR